jgi:hypothetical protein
MTERSETFGTFPEVRGAIREPFGAYPVTIGPVPKAFGMYPETFDALPALDPRVLEKGFFTGPVSAAAALSTDRGARLYSAP